MKDKIGNYFEDIFELTRGQRIGLISFILFTIGGILFSNWIKDKERGQILEVIAVKVESNLSNGESILNQNSQSATFEGIINPNSASVNDLVSSGLNPKIANTLVKFRDKGGYFKSSEDLKKIYGMDKKWLEMIAPQMVYDRYPATSLLKEKEIVSNPVQFDPNSASESILKQVGFSEKVIQTIVNYRSKGGHFYRADDMMKIYGMKASLFEKLAPYISINEPKTNIQKVISEPVAIKNEQTPKSTLKIPINKATIEQWVSIPGIGPAFASKIIRFKNLIGGFPSIQHVGMTPKLPDSVFLRIYSFLEFDGHEPSLSINSITLERLSQHPFCDLKTAIAIVNHRSNIGKIIGFEEIESIPGINKETLRKLKPFLKY